MCVCLCVCVCVHGMAQVRIHVWQCVTLVCNASGGTQACHCHDQLHRFAHTPLLRASRVGLESRGVMWCDRCNTNHCSTGRNATVVVCGYQDWSSRLSRDTNFLNTIYSTIPAWIQTHCASFPCPIVVICASPLKIVNDSTCDHEILCTILRLCKKCGDTVITVYSCCTGGTSNSCSPASTS
jgi:hypothetical protein